MPREEPLMPVPQAETLGGTAVRSGTAKRADAVKRAGTPTRSRKTSAVAELSARILVVLENRRPAGQPDDAATFCTLAQIVERCPGATLAQVAAALKKPPCRTAVVTAIPGDPASPLLLATEAEQLVRSGAMLQQLVCHPVHGCSAATPVRPLSVLWGGLHKSLRKLAADYWPRHLQLLPAGLQAVTIRAGRRVVPGIHDQRYPRPEAVLAEGMVRTLENLKSQGDTGYPSTLRRLAELTSPGAAATVVETAFALETMQAQILAAFPGVQESPLSLAGDADRLASSILLLNFVVSRTVTTDNQGIGVEKLVRLKGLHPVLQPLFAASVRQRISENRMPDGLAAIRLTKKWHVFRLRDVVAGAAPQAAAQDAAPRFAAARETTSSGFAESFEAVFERLSAQSRLPGCVSLADLRPALPGYSREEFDAELIRLRRAGRYSLSVVEGRYPLTEPERQACLTIDNIAHLLVRRRA